MKKTLLVLFALISFGFAANAQNSLGLRGGWGSYFNGEISYQQGMGANRLELDLGIAGGYYNLAGVYQWTWDLPVNGLGWYAGVGAELGLSTGNNDRLGLGICGQLGIEWTIPSLPIKLSVDIRPVYHLLGWGGVGFNPGAALGVRYVF